MLDIDVNKTNTVKYSMNHQPKICSNFSSNLNYVRRASYLSKNKPPLWNQKLRTINLQRVVPLRDNNETSEDDKSKFRRNSIKYQKKDQKDTNSNKELRKLKYNSLIESTIRMKNIVNSKPTLIIKKNCTNGSTEAVSTSSLYGGSQLADFEYRTQILNSSISTRSIPKPYSKHRVVKPKPIRKIISLSSKGSSKNPKRTSRNDLPPSTQTENWFIRAIHGGGSFIKYLEQSDV